MATADVESFVQTLTPEEASTFQQMRGEQVTENFERLITVAENVSQSTIFNACKHSFDCDRTISSWRSYSLPDIIAVAEQWMQVDPATASDETLMEGMRKLAVEDAAYWGMDAGFCFGVAKVVDEQLQQFLTDVAPDHRFTSGLFLSGGVKSRVLQANDDLSAIAKAVRQSESVTAVVATTPHTQLMARLQSHPEAAPVLLMISDYLKTYGHVGYSLDFVEPTQIEDPSALFTALQSMVRADDYDPEKAYRVATERRENAMADIVELLGQGSLEYWQFRYRLWFSAKYYPIREEAVFFLGYCWPALRPLALELGKRFTADGIIGSPEQIFYLLPPEIEWGISARSVADANVELPAFASLAEERFQVRSLFAPFSLCVRVFCSCRRVTAARGEEARPPTRPRAA